MTTMRADSGSARRAVLRSALVFVLTLVVCACGGADAPSRGDEASGDTTAAAVAPDTAPRPGTGGTAAGGAGADTAQQQADTGVTVFFSRGETAVAVRRPVPPGMQRLEAAVRAVLRGPSASERVGGIHSWFSDTTAAALRSVELSDGGRAVVDFEDLSQLIPNASTSAGSAMLLRELNGTVFAQPDVRSIEYRLEGSCEAFWEWLQYGGCQVQER